MMHGSCRSGAQTEGSHRGYGADILEDCGQFAPEEQPKKIVALVLPFIRSV